MKKSFKVILAIILLIVVIAFPIISNYNTLIGLEQNVNTADATIQTQLQRRADLIPNLVNTVKGFASQEKEIFTDIANARGKLAGATNISEQAKANDDLSNALSRLLVVVERYPELKSNENFRDLSIQLEGTENRIAVARQDYNAAVTQYNTKLKRFPTNLIASLFGFEPRLLFTASEGANQVPSVDFNH